STKFTLLGARLGGDLRLIVGEDRQLWQAGHSVEKSFASFAVRESFNSGTADERLRHDFSLGYNSRFRTQAAAVIDYQNQDLLRNWSFGTGYQFLGDRSLRVDADIDWQWRERNGEPGLWLGNYGTSWKESVNLMKPDAGQGIRARRTHGAFRASLSKTPVGLSLSAEGASDFNLIQALNAGDSQGRLEFPFSLGGVQGSTGFRRSFYRSLDYGGPNPGGLDVRDDLASYAESLAVSAPLWAALPFYSLYDDGQREKMSDLASDRPGYVFNSGRFSDQVFFSLRLPGQGNAWDLVKPQSFHAGAERILYQKLDTLEDVLRYSGGVGFQALNVFGAFGSKPVFSFYQSDEYAHSLEAVVSLNRGEKAVWQAQAGQRMGFYGFQGGVLSVINVLNFGSRLWSDSLSMEWTAPVKQSLLSLWYDAFMGRMEEREHWSYLSEMARTEYERLRRESLEMSISSGEDRTEFSFTAGHESIIRVIGRLNLSVFGKLTNSYDSNTKILSFIGSTGITLHVMF
ncbi:MAG: hypothetical protein LBK40_02350, partial [Spirochaetaceae bacterium]|nr:hypothetical protein [Spirochaetaceae bacterium]